MRQQRPTHIPQTNPTLSLLDALKMVRERSAADDASAAEAGRRFLEQQATAVLRPLLPGADPDALRDVLMSSPMVPLQAEQVLFRQGDGGDAMYVLVSGRLRQTIDGEPRGLPDVHPGQLVGEFSLLTARPRSATVTARRDSLLIKIGRAQFDALTERFPQMGLCLAKDMAERVSRGSGSTDSNARLAKTIAIAPTDDSDAYRIVAAQLRQFLGASRDILFLDSRAFASQYRWLCSPQKEHAQEPLVGSILAAEEARFRFIIYVADPTDTVWSARCLRQADRVLFVAKGESTPSTEHPLERCASRAAPSTPRSLVLLHGPQVEQPTGTIRWLKNNRFGEYYHVRPGDSAPMRRLVRRMTGEAIGLVLSGGGARGYAHLGVWRAIEELGIPIDYFGGTSMGALMAASFAMPFSYSHVLAASDDMANAQALFDKTFPIVSLMASFKINRVLRAYYGDGAIEDLWVPFFCVATDLTSAEPVLIDRGPIWKAVRASLAIPGVFSPVIDEDRVLVDGGVIDNLPVAEMRRRCHSDRIIAVNAVPRKVTSHHYDCIDAVSGWRMLLNRMIPFGRRRKVPSIVRTLMRSLEVNSIRRTRIQQAQAQLLIEPHARSLGLLEFEQYRTASAAGYEAAKRNLQNWVELQQVTLLSHTLAEQVAARRAAQAQLC